MGSRCATPVAVLPTLPKKTYEEVGRAMSSAMDEIFAMSSEVKILYCDCTLREELLSAET